MEAIDQGVATNSQVEENVVVEIGDPYPLHSAPLVQQPSRVIFHSILPCKVMLMILPIQIMLLMLCFGIPLWDRKLLRLEPVQPLLKKFHQMKKNIDDTGNLFSVQETLRRK